MSMACSENWLVRTAPNARARLRVLCFPYAGGGPAAFRTWQASLPPDVEVCAVNLPGREERLFERAYTRLDPLIEALVHALEPVLDRPFALFGHSMGAMLAFETAHALHHEHDRVPAMLLVSGRRAPHLPSPYAPIYDLPDSEFVAYLRRLNGTPEAVLREPQLMEVLLPLLRADITISDTYRYVPRPPLPCPIAAFGGQQDSEAAAADLAAWREHTRGGFRLQVFPGGHFFLHSSRTLLLQAISDELMACR